MTLTLDTSLIIFLVSSLVVVVIWLIRLESTLKLLQKDLQILETKTTQQLKFLKLIVDNSGVNDKTEINELAKNQEKHHSELRQLIDFINNHMNEINKKLFTVRKWD